MAQGKALPPSIDMRLPRPPTLARADGDSFLVYELHLTNFGDRPLRLQKMDVATGTGAARKILIGLGDIPLKLPPGNLLVCFP